MTEPSVDARGICKSYKSFFGRGSEVLKDISLQVEPGEIFGLLGPNGSGKTTLVSIFSTLIFPDRGRLRVLGLEAEKNRTKIRSQINFSTAKPNFPWSLTVSESLRHYGMLYGMYGSQLSRAIDESIAAFELEEQRKMKFEDLSTGMKQRLSLAKAMLNRPRLLLLDEPTARASLQQSGLLAPRGGCCPGYAPEPEEPAPPGREAGHPLSGPLRP
jgi:ABC-2 type transport system ATP-binding protein